MKEVFHKPGVSNSRSALKIALIYAVIGVAWIAFSDLALERIFGNTRAGFWAGTLKGWFFVLFTTVFMYSCIKSTIDSIRKSEEALREHQRVLSTLFGNLPGMAYRCKADPECTLEFVSAGAMDLTGYSPEDLTHKQKIDDLIVEEDRDEVRKGRQSELAEGRPFRFTYRIRDAEGRIKWVWERARGVYSDSGSLLAVEGFVTDITERKEAEEALRRSEEIYRALVEGTSDAILMTDTDRVIISANRAFTELFGYTREELEGASVRIIHPSDESFRNFGKYAYPALERASINIEWELKKKDGTIFPIEGTYSIIRGPDGRPSGHVGIMRDITGRKKAERELSEYREHLEEMVRDRTRQLEEAQKALVQKEKLKTLGAIAAEVAHEIRNPLVSIGGFARRLQKKHPESHEAEIILQEARRLEEKLNRISNYLRPVELKIRECHVNSILSETIALLSPELEKEQVALRLELYPELPTAHVDPDVLAQVFVTVLRSAVKSMADKKELAVKTYDRNDSIYVEIMNPVTGKKIKDPELMLLPFDQDDPGGNISSSFKLLKGMGGVLSFSRSGAWDIFTISLEKCSNPGHGPFSS